MEKKIAMGWRNVDGLEIMLLSELLLSNSFILRAGMYKIIFQTYYNRIGRTILLLFTELQVNGIVLPDMYV